MLEALKNPETLKGLAETESDIQQRIDKLVFLTLLLNMNWNDQYWHFQFLFCLSLVLGPWKRTLPG